MTENDDLGHARPLAPPATNRVKTETNFVSAGVVAEGGEPIVVTVTRTPRLSAVRASTVSAKFGVAVKDIKQLKVGGSLDLAGDVAAKLIDAGYVIEYRKG